jgi:hypothetical protein
MRYKLIACRVFSREISLLIATSSAVVDVVWLKQGLHNYPSLLREKIQEEIDWTEAPPDGTDSVARPPEEYSAIILGFGLCARAVAGLKAQRLPLVLPRSHDCIALLLGSHKRYRQEFSKAPGTYWFSPGWIEQSVFPCGAQCALMRDRFAELYGDDNAEYLMEFKRDSLSPYSRAALITWPELDNEEYHRRTEEIAEEFGWNGETLSGDSGLLHRVLNGDWREEETIVCPPGKSFETGNDDEVVRLVDANQSESEEKEAEGA